MCSYSYGTGHSLTPFSITFPDSPSLSLFLSGFPVTIFLWAYNLSFFLVSVAHRRKQSSDFWAPSKSNKRICACPNGILTPTESFQNWDIVPAGHQVKQNPETIVKWIQKIPLLKLPLFEAMASSSVCMSSSAVRVT